MEESVLLINNQTKFKVSSVLNKDTKSYGKQYLCDNKDETCWNSDQGENQWIIISFLNQVIFNKIEIKFQGGFCSSHARIEILKLNDSKTEKSFVNLFEFYPEDVNSAQVFQLNNQDFEPSDCYRIYFDKLTDFFGRLIVYDLKIYGKEIKN